MILEYSKIVGIGPKCDRDGGAYCAGRAWRTLASSSWKSGAATWAQVSTQHVGRPFVTHSLGSCLVFGGGMRFKLALTQRWVPPVARGVGAEYGNGNRRIT
jgi:hypothetical protein